VFVTRDAKIFEHTFPYKSLQGQSNKQNSPAPLLDPLNQYAFLGYCYNYIVHSRNNLARIESVSPNFQNVENDAAITSSTTTTDLATPDTSLRQ
jgi:hypothetical protein